MSLPPLVLIEWEDAYNGNHTWFELSSLPEEVEPLVVHTVGYEVQRNAERTTLVMSLQEKKGESEPHVCDVFVIPEGMIRRRVLLQAVDGSTL